MKKKIMAIIMAIIAISVFTVSSYAADSDQIYIENNSAQVIKVTASLYGYTPNGSSITIGDAILRTDVRSGQNPTYTAVDLDVKLLKNYTTNESYVGVSRILTGTEVCGNTSADHPIGQYINADSNSVSGQNIGGYYHAETPNDGITITSTLGIVLNTDGTLSQDSLATSTMAY